MKCKLPTVLLAIPLAFMTCSPARGPGAAPESPSPADDDILSAGEKSKPGPVFFSQPFISTVEAVAVEGARVASSRKAAARGVLPLARISCTQGPRSTSPSPGAP